MEKLIRVEENQSERLQRSNLFLLIFLSLLTLGAYIGVWFLKQKEQVNNLVMKSGIHFGLWRWFTFVAFTFLFIRIFGPVILTDYGMAYVESFDVMFSFFFVGLLYYSIFRLREVLENEADMELNKYLLFIFHIFYIQFKMNQVYINPQQLVRS